MGVWTVGDLPPTPMRRPLTRKCEEEFRPELATLVSEAPTGDEWIHEIKVRRIPNRMPRRRRALQARRNRND
jgi:hypothetical protein